VATSLPPTESLSASEAERLAAARKLSAELSEAFNEATQIKEMLLEIATGADIADPRRFQVFRKLIRAAGHELGKAAPFSARLADDRGLR